jgi:hypothetical protein
MCASAWKNLTPDFFGFGSSCASHRCVRFPVAQLLSSAAQLLRTRLIRGKFQVYLIASTLAKTAPRALFSPPSVQFRAQKIFCSQVASLRLSLCYYRQRSLKIFSTPCGSRKNFDRRSDA